MKVILGQNPYWRFRGIDAPGAASSGWPRWLYGPSELTNAAVMGAEYKEDSGIDDPNLAMMFNHKLGSKTFSDNAWGMTRFACNQDVIFEAIFEYNEPANSVGGHIVGGYEYDDSGSIIERYGWIRAEGGNLSYHERSYYEGSYDYTAVAEATDVLVIGHVYHVIVARDATNQLITILLNGVVVATVACDDDALKYVGAPTNYLGGAASVANSTTGCKSIYAAQWRGPGSGWLNGHDLVALAYARAKAARII